ncbi:MAG: DUF4389 domain-containing protein [Flavobacteriales bacterium]|nr:DUF4389 domain-containing protein [Flavobacteriales bacterium]
MIFDITYQERYSRGELLLRSFFGWIYIFIPHIFVLVFMQLWAAILSFIAFWSILFTGRYPRSFFDFQVKLLRWNQRVNARMYNLSDGYPAFGLDVDDPAIQFSLDYPERLSRGSVLLKFFFGWLYVAIPHGFVLMFLAIAVQFAVFFNWWIILFTAKSSRSIHDFLVGFLRWGVRVSLYLGYMTDDYPPFRLDPLPSELPPTNPIAEEQV